jgi:hypothetical protein
MSGDPDLREGSNVWMSERTVGVNGLIEAAMT